MQELGAAQFWKPFILRNTGNFWKMCLKRIFNSTNGLTMKIGKLKVQQFLVTKIASWEPTGLWTFNH